MSRKVAPRIDSGADSSMTQVEEENAVGNCRSVDGDEPDVDFLSAAATEDKDYFRLSDGEFEAMCERIDDVYHIHEEMVLALERFAKMIRAFTNGTPTAREIDALHDLAIAHLIRVSEAAVLLDELQQALVSRPLGDLLRALSEQERTDRRECEFSEPSEEAV